MDAPDGEPVTLEPWQILIEHEGRPLKSARGETDEANNDLELTIAVSAATRAR
jgi:hypothetical protein